MEGSIIYLNGKLLPAQERHLSALDRGFTLGDGVFDTLRAVHGRVFRMNDHLDRLGRSAATLQLPLPMDSVQLAEAISAVLEANGLADALIRITVSRGVPAERGLMPPSSPVPTLAIHTTPFRGYPEETYRRGYTATISAIRRNETSPLSYVKSCNYLDSVLARMEADRRGHNEALMLNSAGWLACGSSCNLFLISGERLITPSLECGVLDGITRRTVIELAAGMAIDVSERQITPQELLAAEESFVTNTALGIMPLVEVDGEAIGQGSPGPTTLKLRSAYTELVQAIS